MSYKKITLSLVAVFGACSLNAYEMKPIGFKSTGMGGAGVATARGSLATYYNPALIGFSDYTAEFSLNAGIGIREHRLIDTVDKLDSLDLSGTLDRIADNAPNSGTNTDSDRENIQTAIETLNKIPTANGLQLSPTVSFAAQISKYFAIGAYASTELRANMVIDKDKLSLIVKDVNSYYQYDPTQDTYINSSENSYKTKSLQYAIEGEDGVEGDSTTYLNVSAITMAELPVSFAYTIPQDRGTWSLGATIKAMSVETFTKNFDIDTDTDAISEDYDENKKTYSTFGVDLGLLYREKATGLTLGIVGKNINKPSFETKPDDSGRIETFEMDPFFRFGMSLPIWNDNIELAIDADLQESDTTYEGMKSRYVGGGIEFHPASWAALRAGLMKNVATESIDEGMIYTAGLGFGLKWFQFDISAMVSEESGTYDGNEIPKYMNVNFSLISRWGGD